MTAIDTNVLVRFLTRDDERQARSVYAVFKKAEAARVTFLIPLLVVLETIWVLESVYEKSREEILDSFDKLKSMPILEFEKVQVLQDFLAEGRGKNVDLSDLLIAFSARSCGCDDGITFDKKASKLPFFRLLT